MNFLITLVVTVAIREPTQQIPGMLDGKFIHQTAHKLKSGPPFHQADKPDFHNGQIDFYDFDQKYFSAEPLAKLFSEKPPKI